MSDTFDPNSWPRSRNTGGSHASGDASKSSTSGSGASDDSTAYDSEEEINLDEFAADDFEHYGVPPQASKPAAAPTGAPVGGHYGRPNDDFDLDLDESTFPAGSVRSPDDFDDFDDDSANTYGDDFGQSDYGRSEFARDDFDDDGFASPGYDDQTDDGYNAGYGDEFDDFNDDEPDNQSGGKAKLIIAILAALVIAAVAIGLVITLFGGGSPEEEETTGENTETPTVGEATEAPTEVLVGLDEAFSAWGRYAVTGELDEVRPHFVQNQGQWLRFEAESRALKESPPGGEPLEFNMATYRGFKINDGDWLIRGPVTSTRPGAAVETFNWEVRMVQETEGGPWKIKSVRNI